MIAIGEQYANLHSLRIVDAFRRRRFRTLSRFAEDEIIIPTGPAKNTPYRLDTQPYCALAYRAIESGLFNEIVATGPSQTGKTLQFFVIPLIYHLFEVNENVIGAVPDFDIVADKWENDILPVLERTRYRRLLPATGRGAKGGRSSKIRFRNGVELRWMTAGGGDKSRTAYTARVICMTEVDGFDTKAVTSPEASKINQIEARSRAWDRQHRIIYKECTVSLKEAHTWNRYTSGTQSQLALPCPHCLEFVSPERADLHGWKEATNDIQAEKARFHCPACGEQWSEDERANANRNAVLVHHGQHVTKDGLLVGNAPETRTLGFRWSAVNNLLISAGSVGVDEWQAARATDEDDAQRKMCQFVWAIPYHPVDEDDSDKITAEILAKQTSGYPRGQFPAGAELSLGIDVNKPVMHWTMTAMLPDGRGFIIDYGKQGIRSREVGFQSALLEGLQKLISRLSIYPFKAAGVDSRWRPEDVAFALKSIKDRRFRPYIGCGKGQFQAPDYYHPTAISTEIVAVGNEWYEKIHKTRRQIVVNGNANFWKLQVQSRIAMVLPSDEQSSRIDGPIKLYDAVDESEHFAFCRQLMAEETTIEHDAKRGPVTVFKAIRKANHWLDSTSISLVFADRLLSRRRQVVSSIPVAAMQSSSDSLSFSAQSKIGG